jgi:hypothetical protein
VSTLVKSLAVGPLPERVTLCAFSEDAMVALASALNAG